MNSSAFLATRCLKQLALDEMQKLSVDSRIVHIDFYIDDLITGAETTEDALKIRKETMELLSKGGFELRKWSSNEPRLFSDMKENNGENSVIHFNEDD